MKRLKKFGLSIKSYINLGKSIYNSDDRWFYCYQLIVDIRLPMVLIHFIVKNSKTFKGITIHEFMELVYKSAIKQVDEWVVAYRLIHSGVATRLVFNTINKIKKPEIIEMDFFKAKMKVAESHLFADKQIAIVNKKTIAKIKKPNNFKRLLRLK